MQQFKDQFFELLTHCILHGKTCGKPLLNMWRKGKGYIDVTLKWLDRRKGIQNKIGSYLEVKQEISNTLHCWLSHGNKFRLHSKADWQKTTPWNFSFPNKKWPSGLLNVKPVKLYSSKHWGCIKWTSKTNVAIIC